MNSERAPDVQNSPQDWRHRLGWLVADRIVLGLIVAVIAFAFNAYLQRDQKIADYQKVLFEKRIKAYEDLTAVSRDASKRCAIAYSIFLGASSSPKAPDLAARLAAAGAGIWDLAPTGDIGGSAGDGGGGAGNRADLTQPQLSTWEVNRLSDAVKALQEVEQKRTEASFYVSTSVNSKVDILIETLLGDLKILERRIRNRKGHFASSMSVDDKRFVELAISRAEESYSNLLKAITEALRVKDIILG